MFFLLCSEKVGNIKKNHTYIKCRKNEFSSLFQDFERSVKIQSVNYILLNNGEANNRLPL